MANCNLCGKRMGILENSYSQFPDDSGVCKECHDRLQHVINPHINELRKAQTEREQVINIVIEKYANSIDSTNYLRDYVNMAWEDGNKKLSLEKQQEIFTKLQQDVLKLKITTGYSFDGYKIIDYKGVVSGETVIGTGLLSEFLASIDDTLGMSSNSFASKMRQVKENAITNLKIQAASVDGNAIIGVDFDYLTFSNNMIGVSANGTAVVIEKIEE